MVVTATLINAFPGLDQVQVIFEHDFSLAQAGLTALLVYTA
jgi:hypothetical protein